jgi:FtsP/CotA-like multicopper oxidase with cupredoxin domain
MNREERTVFSIGAFGVAVAALVVAFVAVFAVRDKGGTEATAGEGPAYVDVALSEFKINPATIITGASDTELRITNTGSVVHNLEIPEVGIASGDILPGESKTVTVGADVADGEYQMLCTIAGHAQSGMVGTAVIGGEAGGSNDVGQSTGGMTWDQMDAAMSRRALSFPAKTLGGPGGTVLEPEILADGTKQFEITASIVDWEVEPGKMVKAWAYNGLVPGPEIRVDVGDKVRVIFKNELPESSDIHFHGVRVPNSMDGVDPFTQDPVPPGGSFIYEFTTVEKAVGMYHSHHNAQVQVPNGLAGAFIIGDYTEIPEELKQRGFEQVDEEITMVLSDSGTIGLGLNGKSFPATQPYTAKVGDVLLVHYFNEGLVGHPMHLHQPHGWIIARDGVEMLQPVPGDNIWVAPGERITVLYKALDPGVWAWHCHILNHAEGPQGLFGMTTALIVME